MGSWREHPATGFQLGGNGQLRTPYQVIHIYTYRYTALYCSYINYDVYRHVIAHSILHYSWRVRTCCSNMFKFWTVRSKFPGRVGPKKYSGPNMSKRFQFHGKYAKAGEFNVVDSKLLLFSLVPDSSFWGIKGTWSSNWAFTGRPRSTHCWKKPGLSRRNWQKVTVIVHHGSLSVVIRYSTSNNVGKTMP